MFGRKVNARWKTKGLRYGVNDGVLTGKIYTAWPMSIGLAIGRTFLAYLATIGLTAASGILPTADSGLHNIVFSIIWIVVFFGAFPYFLFSNGKRIAITRTHCTIAGKKYRLADMTAFTAKEVSHRTPDQFYIEFSYGKNRKKIKVRNIFENQVDIIATLNREVQSLLHPEPTTAEDMLTARSASF